MQHDAIDYLFLLLYYCYLKFVLRFHGIDGFCDLILDFLFYIYRSLSHSLYWQFEGPRRDMSHYQVLLDITTSCHYEDGLEWHFYPKLPKNCYKAL